METVIKEVSLFAETQRRQIQRLTQIGIALSAEKNIKRLLEMIIDEKSPFEYAGKELNREQIDLEREEEN